MAELGDNNSWKYLINKHLEKQREKALSNSSELLSDEENTLGRLGYERLIHPPEDTISDDFSPLEAILREKNKKMEIKIREKNITIFERKIMKFPQGGGGELELVIDTELESEDMEPLFVASMKKYKSVFKNEGTFPSIQEIRQVPWAKPREYKLIFVFESKKLN